MDNLYGKSVQVAGRFNRLRLSPTSPAASWPRLGHLGPPDRRPAGSAGPPAQQGETTEREAVRGHDHCRSDPGEWSLRPMVGRATLTIVRFNDGHERRPAVRRRASAEPASGPSRHEARGPGA